MKFQIVDAEHSEKVQLALFRMGYRWAGVAGQNISYVDKAFIYTTNRFNNLELTHGAEAYFFDRDPREEYVYRFGLVEPRAGRPLLEVFGAMVSQEVAKTGGTLETAFDEVVPTGVVPTGTISTPLTGPYFANNAVTGVGLSVQAPLGLKPRFVADRNYQIERGLELAAAINRYTNAKLVVPVEWVEEYNERVEEIRKLEKTA